MNTSPQPPQHSINMDDKVINEFSKLLINLHDPSTLRQLMSMLKIQLEETLSQHSIPGSTSDNSSYYEATDVIKVPVTPKFRVGVKSVAAGYLLNVSSSPEEESRPTPSPIKYFSPYVELIRDLVIDDHLAKSVTDEATSLWPRSLSPNKNKVGYTWLSKDNTPYIFDNVYHPAVDITQYHTIYNIMQIIDSQTGNFGLDSCLLAFYERGEVKLSYHADDEPEIDQDAPIVVLSLGVSRVLSFSKKNKRDQPIGEMALSDCSIVVMKPGCQQELVHSVLPNPGCQGRRISLSFRKVKRKLLCTAPPRTLSEEWTSSPAYIPMPTSVPSSTPAPTSASLPMPKPTYADIVVGTTPARQQKRPHAPRMLYDGYQEPPPGKLPLTEEVKVDPKPISKPKPTPQHLVIGDSLVRDIWLPNCVTVCVSGATPRDLLQHIRRNKFELIPDDQYRCIRSITICCGTNSLGRPHIPIGDIKSDYDMLVRELVGLFPTAKIALVNVPPRKYISPEVVDRIFDFNSFLYHIAQSYYAQFSFIDLFRQLLNPNKYINKHYYRPDLLHFNQFGNNMLMDRISEFNRYGK